MTKNEKEKNKLKEIESCLKRLETQGLVMKNNLYTIHITRMNKTIKPNSTWTDQEGQSFLITGLGQQESQTWVTYKKVSNGLTFNCLAPAFLQRFFEFIN